MRLHRFFSQEKIDLQGQIVINNHELSKQLSKVFRYRTGDQAILFDGSGNDFLCKIDLIKSDVCYFTVIQTMKSTFLPSKEITLFVSLIKKDKFEWLVEKATEIGVSQIIPVLAERSEKKDQNIDRLRKIAAEASEQSGRGDITEIGQIVSVEEALKYNIDLVLDIHGKDFDRAGLSHAHKIKVLIGPEGGWSQNEKDLFLKYNVQPISIGKQVLKTETAGIAITSLLLL